MRLPPKPLAAGFRRARAQNGVPNIERADKLVQLIAKQKGLSHPVIDGIVALVDRGSKPTEKGGGGLARAGSQRPNLAEEGGRAGCGQLPARSLRA